MISMTQQIVIIYLPATTNMALTFVQLCTAQLICSNKLNILNLNVSVNFSTQAVSEQTVKSVL